MSFKGVFSIISDLKKKILYIIAVFGSGALISFSYMGDIIKKIESDMFWHRLNISDKSDASRQLLDISNNLESISNMLYENNSVIAQNLSRVSGELLNLSNHINTYKPNIIYQSPMEVVMLELKMSLVFGLLIVSPLILFYIYRGARSRFTDLPFIRGKKLLILSTIVASIVLFLIGAGYSYYFMLPNFLDFIYQDAMNAGVNANFSINELISFIVLMTVILGVAFELPVILFFFVHLGMLSRKTLTYYRRHVYLLLLIIAAWITPDPTMLMQIMVALPFIVLYEANLILMRLTGK